MYVYPSYGINEEIVELYEECTDVNFQPSKYTENNDYFSGDEADPDNDLFNRLQVDSHYYTYDLLIRCAVTLFMLACKLAMTPFLRQMDNVALVYRIGMKTLKNTRKGHYFGTGFGVKGVR